MIVPKIIRAGGDFTKLRQKQFCLDFLRHSIAWKNVHAWARIMHELALEYYADWL